jgi:pSer/pThr/pTyr-binding forkhead associated (FHA) protein
MSRTDVKIVKNFRTPSKPGVHYRLLSLTGVSKGTSFYLEGKRAVIGRSENIEISILDPKASRQHAELVRYGDTYVLTDLKSQNGVVVNDLKVAQHKLISGDKIIIGSTVFKYDRIEVNRKEVQLDHGGDNENISEVTDNESGTKDKGDKKKKLVIVLGLALIYLFLFGDEEEVGDNKNKKKRIKDVSSSYEDVLKKKKDQENKEEENKVNALIHRGQREFREENYFRALEEFNQALIMDPGNGRASFYKRKTKQALDDLIEKYFTSARRDVDSYRLESALVSYCAIIRLLEGYEDDERYVQSLRQIGYLEKKLGMIEGDYNCLPE